MGRFASKSSAQSREARETIKINPYELPEKALAIIANICSKSEDRHRIELFRSFESKLSKDIAWERLCHFISDNRKYLSNIDFWISFNQLVNKLLIEIQANEDMKATKIVVGGGFSSGKSTLLNTITGAKDLLPTAIEPCSVVQTLIYCTSKVGGVEVKAKNLKDVVVRLDKDILQSIQHESKSHSYLASVLDKIYVDLPSRDLDGYAFIDTPGYNNSEHVNLVNGVTDEETAKKALNESELLMWVVDAGNGTVPRKDKEFIDEYLKANDERRVLIVFNKADKKGQSEMNKIINESSKVFSSYGNRIIDILGYSSVENLIYVSRKGYKSLVDLIKSLKTAANYKNFADRTLMEIKNLFEDEIEFCSLVHSAHNEEKNRLVNAIDDIYRKRSRVDTLSRQELDKIYEMLQKEKNNQVEEIKKADERCLTLKKHRDAIHSVLSEYIRQFRRDCHNQDIPDVRIKHESYDIFAAIESSDYSKFTSCFAKGVSLKQTKNGYSPLTYAVKHGNKDMVRFFIDRGADLGMCDGRGMNAFHTAVEESNKHIIMDLLKADSSLLYSKTRNGERKENIAQKNKFETWICNLK